MSRTDRSWVTSHLDAHAHAALAEGLPASRLWSVLLDVLQCRAAARSTTDLMQQWRRDDFARPASVDQRTLIALDAHVLAAAHAFEAVELSPVAPLGTCSVVGLSSQNRVLSALRGTEVVADPTNVLALECAHRLQRDPAAIVRLATAHRCIRTQELPKQPGFTPHFRIFCLATAGRERHDHAFVVEALSEHITTLLAALGRLEQHGYAFPSRRVTVFSTDTAAALGDRLASAVPDGVVVSRATLHHAYYHRLRFQIAVRSTAGIELPLIDGGAFDWVARLASNRRLVFVASGMGSQLAALLYRP